MMIKEPNKNRLVVLYSTSKRIKWIGVYLFLIVLISTSCERQKSNNQLSVEAKTASSQFSMSLLPDELGKLNFKNRFIGIIPRKLTEKAQEQEIELYVFDAPAFKFEEFNIETIKQQKLTPKRITSLEQLTGELNNANLGFDNFSVARKVETSVNAGKLTVKDLGSNTTVTCTCPCTVQFGDDKVKYSCD